MRPDPCATSRPAGRSRTACAVAGLLVALAAAGSPLAAQPTPRYELDFPTARAQFDRGEARRAAYTVSLASAYVREESGRCRDADAAMRLLAAESKLDALVSRLRGDNVRAGASLDSVFALTDRLMSEHHYRQAAFAWSIPRLLRVPELARDLAASATLFERALRWEGRSVDPTAAPALADAQRIATLLAAAPAAPPPPETGRVIEALGRVVVTPSVMVAVATP